jgi:beta-glucosidase
MRNRTYRYFSGKLQYPFGYGLSYTTFDYNWIKKPDEIPTMKDSLRFSVSIKNTGKVNGDEVAQVYIEYPAVERMPIRELKAYKRVNILSGSDHVIHFSIAVSELKKWDLKEKNWRLYPGEYRIVIGGNSQDSKLSTSITIKEKLK